MAWEIKGVKVLKRKLEKKYLNITMFQPCISWEQIEEIMYKKDFKKFCKWMEGQTCPIGGVYKHDLERFLLGLPIVD